MSTHKPYIYVMPEEFMADQGVPAHWRLLGLLNGFFANGKPFYGSNAWLMEQLRIKSERTIQEAIKTLEGLKKVQVQRNGPTRVITMPPRNQMRGTPQQTAGLPSNQLRGTSDSNAVKEKASPLFEVVKDGPFTKREPTNKPAMTIRGALYRLIEKELGSAPTPHTGDYVRIVEALKRLDAKQITYIVEEGILDKGKRTVRECLTARAIDMYLQDN